MSESKPTPSSSKSRTTDPILEGTTPEESCVEAGGDREISTLHDGSPSGSGTPASTSPGLRTVDAASLLAALAHNGRPDPTIAWRVAGLEEVTASVYTDCAIVSYSRDDPSRYEGFVAFAHSGDGRDVLLASAPDLARRLADAERDVRDWRGAAKEASESYQRSQASLAEAEAENERLTRLLKARPPGRFTENPAGSPAVIEQAVYARVESLETLIRDTLIPALERVSKWRIGNADLLAAQAALQAAREAVPGTPRTAQEPRTDTQDPGLD